MEKHYLIYIVFLLLDRVSRSHATTLSGLEKILAREVQALPQVENIDIQKRGVSFEGTERTGFAALLWLRTSLKLMEKLESGKTKTKLELQHLINQINWSSII